MGCFAYIFLDFIIAQCFHCYYPLSIVDCCKLLAYSLAKVQQFWFEKPLQAYENFKMHMHFVWGVQAVDDGDYTNPNSYGNLHYDNNFNVSSRSAQLWILNFCQSVRQQPFYKETLGMLLPNCFIENLIDYMKRR